MTSSRVTSPTSPHPIFFNSASLRVDVYKRQVNTPFSEQLPLAQLHWIISDENESITVESMSDGLHIYDNPVGVLTNNPPFPQQMFQLNNYMYLSPKQPENTFCENLALDAYSRGIDVYKRQALPCC